MMPPAGQSNSLFHYKVDMLFIHFLLTFTGQGNLCHNQQYSIIQ